MSKTEDRYKSVCIYADQQNSTLRLKLLPERSKKILSECL